jgi:heme exporter protein C
MARKILLGIWMSAVIVASFLYLPPVRKFADPDAARIIVYHVPTAMVAAIAFIVAMVYAVQYLMRRNLMDDAKSAVSAELGLIFTVLATITGSIFARMEWGSWWNGDPRERSIVVLLLIYAAYLALRSAVDGVEKRARLSAVYSILALPAMLFLMFILPRVIYSNHPADTLVSEGGLSMQYRLVLYPAMLGFLALYVWIFRMKVSLAGIRLKMKS